MARKILGIDIDDYSVKFVQVEKPVRGNATIRALEKKIPLSGNGNKPEISMLIKETLEEHKLFSDDYTISISSGKILVREVILPFKERAKIDKIIKFNIEQSIPFQPEDVIADFEVKNVSSAGNTVVAYIVKKEDVKKYLELFETVGIEPKVITFSPYCLATAAKSSGITESETFAIVDIGSNSASVYINNKGIPCFSRKFESKLISFIETASDKMNISVNDTENSIFTSEAVSSDNSNPDDNKEISGLVGDYAESLSTDILVSLASYESKHPDERIDKIFITGRGASISALPEKLRETTALPVETLKCSPSFEYSSPDDNPENPIYSTAITAALSELPFNRRKVNFRREEFSYEWVDSKFKKRLRNVSVFVAVILTLFCVNSVFSLIQLKKNNSELGKSIEALYRSMVPEGKIVDVVVQSRQNLEEMAKKAETFSDVVDGRITPLDVLNALSVNIEKGWSIVTEGLNMEGRRIDVKGSGISVDEFEKYKMNLLNSEIFESVEIKKIEKDKSGESSSFRMELKLRK